MSANEGTADAGMTVSAGSKAIITNNANTRRMRTQSHTELFLGPAISTGFVTLSLGPRIHDLLFAHCYRANVALD
jgi:hypothetical protein